MGRVDSIEKCRNCGGLLHTSYNYKNGEENILCTRCGEHYEAVARTNESGTKYLTDEKGRFLYEETFHPGNGMLYLSYLEGYGARLLSLKDNSEESVARAMKSLQLENVDKEKSYLTVMRDGKLSCLFGKMPPNYEEVEL